MEVLCEAGENMVLVRANRSEIREQDVNARVHAPEMLERLAANIANEKRLESVPFGVLRGDGAGTPLHIELISGHHRVRAATIAGVDDFLVLADKRDLSREQIIAKQLAHNSIQGRDDAVVLGRLLDEISTPDLKLEAFVSIDRDVLAKVDLDELSEGVVEFKSAVVALVFLPEQKKRIDATIEKVLKKTPKGAVELWALPAGMSELLGKVMTKLGRKEGQRGRRPNRHARHHATLRASPALV